MWSVIAHHIVHIITFVSCRNNDMLFLEQQRKNSYSWKNYQSTPDFLLYISHLYIALEQEKKNANVKEERLVNYHRNIGIKEMFSGVFAFSFDCFKPHD